MPVLMKSVGASWTTGSAIQTTLATRWFPYVWLQNGGHKSLPWKRVDLTLARDKGWDLEQTVFTWLTEAEVSKQVHQQLLFYLHAH